MYQGLNGSPVLTLPKSMGLSLWTGMRTSLEGTQASGAGESHTQEANVAEVSYGKPVMGESEGPEKVRATRRRAIRGNARLTRPINR